MASSKISELTQITNTTADDLLLVSHTSDSGSTYNSRHISRANLQDDLTITHGQVSDFDTGVQENTLDSLAAPTSDVDINSQKLTNLSDPANPQDAATKAYVDAAANGLDVKDSVRVATTTDITLSGTQTIDGVAVIAGDRVLVKDQATGSENGIYVVAAGAWSRSEDADNTPSGEVTSGMFTFIEEGTTNASAGFILQTANPITLGSTSLSFAQFSGAGQITAGTGLAKSGNTLSVHPDVMADIADVISLSGVAGNATDLGSFTGSTIDAGSTIKEALQDVVNAVELAATDARVDEIDQNVDDLISLTGVVENTTTLGTFTGGTIADSSTIKGALQALETLVEAEALEVDELTLNQDDLVTLSGVAENATHLGTFTGGTIVDNSTVKVALQALETAAEGSVQTGDNLTELVGSTSADSEPASYLFVVVDANDGSIKVIDKTFIEVE
ncbi:predicted protein [Cyanophage PSS2]|uniref:virion structural protein n=1 Tax=Cyanophage PSS2 TaxID=658401 RepID=UPI0001B04020|nr:virion structural protein [Cyanophage PSS2]ACT65636.1 capsid decoration protein [Cyanophage PSS2]ACY75777.1 predicted protein [Cyanophage PSS2]